MTYESLLNEFEFYLKQIRKSKKTIDAYILDINQFLNYIDNPISKITNMEIENYKEYMINKKNYSITTVNRKLVAINLFFKFNQIPIVIIKEKLQNQNFLNNVLTYDDIENIIKQAKKKNDYRFIAAITTLKLTGLRISELLQLKVSDINKDTITILGKGSKRRNVFIPIKVRAAWQEYIPYRINKSDFLFTGERGAITRSTFHKHIRKYGELAKIPKEKLHLHNNRHYYCKSLADKGISIDTIADLVGHSDINITKLYTRKSKQELLDIANTL